MPASLLCACVFHQHTPTQELGAWYTRAHGLWMHEACLPECQQSAEPLQEYAAGACCESPGEWKASSHQRNADGHVIQSHAAAAAAVWMLA